MVPLVVSDTNSITCRGAVEMPVEGPGFKSGKKSAERGKVQENFTSHLPLNLDFFV